MNTTESMDFSMRLKETLPPARSVKTAETGRTSSQSSPPAGRDFKAMLKQKGKQADPADKTAPKGQSSAADEAASDVKPDQVRQEVAAAVTVFAQSAAPVLLQTQPASVSTQQAVSALNQAASAQTQPSGAQSPAAGAIPVSAQAVQAADPQSTQAPFILAAENQPSGAGTQTAPQTQADPQTQRGVAPGQTETIRSVQNGQSGKAADAGENAGANAEQDRKDDGVQVQHGQTNMTRPLFHNVETAPVKVGELPIADTRSQNLDTQLANQIDATLHSGAQHVEIRLTPENLGTVMIDLTRGQDGTLQVVLHTTTEKAADLLAQHSGTLGHLLQAGTQSTVQVEVRPQEANQQYQQNEQQQRNGQNAYQQQHRRQQNEDFLQQLRLGLVSLDEAVS